jgi:hypothetical protein
MSVDARSRPFNLPQQQEAAIESGVAAIRPDIDSRRTSLVSGTRATVQSCIDGISGLIGPGNRSSVGNHDSAELPSCPGMRDSGRAATRQTRPIGLFWKELG